MANTFIVTGASTGIGRATAKRLADDGYTVFNVDKDAPTDAGAATFAKVDLSDVDAIRETVGNIAADNAVVGLVNNAGFGQMASLEETTPELMELTWRINVLGPAMCAQTAVPSMKANGFGRIVNITSRAALGRELRTGYAGTKGNLTTMTRVWALELAKHGITVNAIGPGPIGTELYDRMNPPDSPRTKAIIASVPVGRIGTPDDIANAVSFFADRRSAFVNGQVLYVCGGLTIGAGPI